MKTCKCHFFHWMILTIGVASLVCAAISRFWVPGFLGIIHTVNLVHLANSFFLLAIASKFMCGCWKHKECNEESEPEKK